MPRRVEFFLFGGHADLNSKLRQDRLQRPLLRPITLCHVPFHFPEMRSPDWAVAGSASPPPSPQNLWGVRPCGRAGAVGVGASAWFRKTPRGAAGDSVV